MTSHPRDRFDEISHGPAETAFMAALNSGRLHHGWLLTGPEGVGKAGFAYRAARRLLGARPDTALGPLGTWPDDPVNRLVSARAHPDLLVLERQEEGGKVKRTLSVDQARELPEFFSKSPSRAQWRVAIVDSADDLNINAANALLKILEEPPERGILLLVSHAPGRLLATIRSRCRRLNFPPWDEATLVPWLQNRLNLPQDTALGIAQAAGGAPGRALILAGDEVAEIDQWVETWLNGEKPSAKFVDGLKGPDGGRRFELILDRLAFAVRERAVQAARAGAPHGEDWATLWSDIHVRGEQVSGLNLDRQEMLFGLLNALEDVRIRTAC